MTDPVLNRFESAWAALRSAVAQAETNPTDPILRQALVDAVDEATIARYEAREGLAATHGGHWVGDQHLFVVETKVGAWAKELDAFVPAWTVGGGGLTTTEILAAVRPLILPPGSGAPDSP